MSRALWYQFAQQFNTLRLQFAGKLADPGCIAIRSIEVVSQTHFDWVLVANEYNWDGGRSRFRCECRHCPANCRDDSNVTIDQIDCQCRQLIIVTICPAVLNGNVLTLDIAALFETVMKCSDDRIGFAGRPTAKPSDLWWGALLRMGSSRSHDKRSYQRDELPPSHVSL